MAGYDLLLDMDRDGTHAGDCEGCRWWQCEVHRPGAEDVGRCTETHLILFDLRVSAHSGCNHFEPAPVEAGALAAGGGR